MTLGALGMLSGAVAWALINLIDIVGLRFEWILVGGDYNFNPFTLFPGLVFGLVVGVLLHRRGKVQGLRATGYVAAAWLAYFCAIIAAMHVDDVLPRPEPEMGIVLAISGIAGGIVGSLLLGLMTMVLLRAPARLVLRLPVLVGGAAGALLGIIEPIQSDWPWDRLAFFVLWQGAYAASLAPLLRPAA